MASPTTVALGTEFIFGTFHYAADDFGDLVIQEWALSDSGYELEMDSNSEAGGKIKLHHVYQMGDGRVSDQENNDDGWPKGVRCDNEELLVDQELLASRDGVRQPNLPWNTPSPWRNPRNELHDRGRAANNEIMAAAP
jgi:hypothetical protein